MNSEIEKLLHKLENFKGVHMGKASMFSGKQPLLRLMEISQAQGLEEAMGEIRKMGKEGK